MVEDEAPIREGVCDYLSECDYEMIAASDGQEAIDLFDSHLSTTKRHSLKWVNK